ncbi:MAG: hypothetical protein ACXWN2_08070 [Candidatus Limnocylindrales bacterium]
MNLQQTMQFLQSIAPPVIVISLLCGPTVAFLIVRAFIGRQSARRQAHLGLTEPASTTPLEELIERGALWICPACRSLNLDIAEHCYRCASRRPTAQPAVAAAAPDAATAVRPPVPVIAPEVAVARVPEPVALAAAAVGPGEAEATNGTHPWCPLLGVRSDSRTVYTFAHPDHRCHAAKKPTTIEPGHQAAFCLTTAYPACVLYRSLAERTTAARAPATPSTARPG